MDIITRDEAKVLGLTHYYTGKLCKHGHDTKRFVSTHYCTACAAREYTNNKEKLDLYKQDWRKKNEEKCKARSHELYMENRDDRLAKNKIEYSAKKEKPELMMFDRCKSRAATKNIEFTISVLDIAIPKMCPYLGIELFPGIGSGGKDNSPSLDRIDSSKGYIPGNVEVISNRANTIKNCGTADEHVLIGNRMKLMEVVS